VSALSRKVFRLDQTSQELRTTRVLTVIYLAVLLYAGFEGARIEPFDALSVFILVVVVLGVPFGITSLIAVTRELSSRARADAAASDLLS
jgi:hypothetical protein